MIITQTPLRISFLGGNTDFRQYFKKYGGCVLSTAIDKYIYCIITQRFDKKIYVNWSKKEIVNSVDEIEHDLVREAMKKTGIKNGVEITFLADIPSEGSGLGSSSSVLVGVLNALHQYLGESVSAQQLASEAVEIEIDILKKPIGIQDQYIAAYGGFNFFEYKKNGKVSVTPVAITGGLREDLDNSLMLFYTGISRQSSQILTTVSANIAQKNDLLNQNKVMAKTAFIQIEHGNILELGKMLDQNWQIKKQMANSVSNPEIETMYAKALSAGAIGGKIAGAGGGGFLLLMVPYDHRDAVRRALENYREMPFRLARDGSKVIFNIRSY